MPDTRVKADVADGVLTIELESDNGMNLLSVKTRKELMEVLRAYESDDALCCVLISSHGRAFSAGADLKEVVGLTPKEARTYSRFVRSFLEYVEGYAKPTMALVDGLALGGGLELLMTLDIVLASPRSSFGQTELNVGLIPGGGGSQRLPRIVGVRRAKEMIFTGSLISAKEASEAGLVTRVVDADRLRAEAAGIIQRLRTKSHGNLRLVKKAINEGLWKGQASGLELESRLYSEVLGSQETKKEIRNFLERRKP